MQNRVAIITGAAGGLGQGIAMGLAQAGATIVVNYRQSEETAGRLVEAIGALGRNALAVHADITDESQVTAMVQQTLDAFGHIDILINNAGVSRDAVSWKMSLETWQEVLNTNLTGAFLCTKAVVPAMRRTQWGRIVNISSIVCQMGVPGTAAYSASKAGLIGLTKTTAREVIRQNITVNCLALGYFDAGMMLSLSSEVQQQVIAQIPMGRLGKVEEIVHAIRFLCDEKAGYITGQVLGINGGYYM